MAKFFLNNLSEEKRIQMISEFYDAINSLKGREEIKLFFRDLLSLDEIAMLMRRIEVATLLSGNFTYDQIAELLKVGKSKVTNVQKSLVKNGGGYKIIIKRLLDSRKNKIQKLKKFAKNQDTIFAQLKQKYPSHFLLVDLIDELGEFLFEDKEIKKEALINTPSNKEDK